MGEVFVRKLRRPAVTLPFFLEGTFPSLTSLSCCEVVTAGLDWVADKFVWVRLPNERFRPWEKSSVPVMSHRPNRRCCHALWYAEFPNRHLYSGSLLVLRWATVAMALVTEGYNCLHAVSDFVGLPSSLLGREMGLAVD